jgi:uncharacterized RDD family membrane protein YckC
MAMSQGPSDADPGAPSAHPLDEMWYVWGKAAAEGPYKGHVLKDMIKTGALGAASNVAPVGATQWTVLANVPAFASCLPPPAVVRYAGFWIRLLAGVIDLLLLQVLLIVVGLIVSSITILILHLSGATSGQEPAFLQALPVLALLGCALFYFIHFPSGAWQATPGKRICGLRIVRTDGGWVTRGLALGRLASCLLSAKLLLIGFLMIGWTKQKTGLHDMICGTRVVHGKQ